MTQEQIARLLNIILSALQLLPLGLSTIAGVKHLISLDPNIPADLQELLKSTSDDDTAALNAVAQWLKDNPPAPGVRATKGTSE